MNRQLIEEAIMCAIAAAKINDNIELAEKYQRALQSLRNSLPQFAVVGKTWLCIHNMFAEIINEAGLPFMPVDAIVLLLNKCKELLLESEIDDPFHNSYDEDKGMTTAEYWQKVFDETAKKVRSKNNPIQKPDYNFTKN